MAMEVTLQAIEQGAEVFPLCAVQQYVHALRYPPSIFGASAPPGLEADHEERDWSQALQDIRSILDFHGVSPQALSAKLQAAAHFVQLHDLRLCGNPWLHVMRFRNVASISYVIHLDLDQADANTWNDRFHEKLLSQDMPDLPFYVNLRERGPTR
ncbi:hypothetical protein [Roseateles sp. L2-2]|uniref:hypothetical protein n=1 Tax=Roseateles sp. L2-2 TaxID=3422597 RepID=UPI003D3677FD